MRRIMKSQCWLIGLICVFFSSAYAEQSEQQVNGAEFQRYESAMVAYLQAQIGELNRSINLLSTQRLNDQELFEQIGEPGFSAIDETLQLHGFTVQTFYQFKYDHELELAQWLSEDDRRQKQMDDLLKQRDDLLQQYDTLMKSRTAAQNEAN